MSRTTYKSNKVHTLVAVGVFSAFAYVCCVMFHFKAAFLSFDLKDAVMTVGAMIFGPVYGLAMSVIVSLIELATISTTQLYGFVMNVLSSCTFVCVGSLIYSRKRTLNGALIGMVSSILAMTAVMLVANLVITPFYMGVSTAEVAALIPTLLLPFNLTKALFNASLVFIIYKPVTSIVKRAGFYRTDKTAEDSSVAETASVIGVITSGNVKKAGFSPVVIAVAAVVGALSLVYFFTSLGGSFSFN